MKYRFILMRDCYKAAEELAVLVRAFNAINYGITGVYSDVNMIKED